MHIIAEIINMIPNGYMNYKQQAIVYIQKVFFGKTNEFDQNYNTSSSYSQTYQLVANVIEKVDKNKYKIQVK